MKGITRIFVLAVSICLLLLLQELLIPKYMEHAREGALTGEYYANRTCNRLIQGKHDLGGSG